MSEQDNETPKTMRAIVYEDYGDASVLHLSEMPTPEPSKRQLLIRVRAAGLNPIDARMRSGEMRYLLPGGFPRIPGFDVAGEIVSAPSGSGFLRGDRVMAFLDKLRGGGYAEYAVCSVGSAAKLPAEFAYLEAAAVPLAASTAYQSLVHKAGITPGHRVLINGASGGVGMFAIQIAAAKGAEVTGVASGEKESFVRSLGANDFIDYHEADFTHLDQQWDIIFDVAGKSRFRDARRVLAEDGQFVSTEPSARNFLITVLTAPLSKRGRAMLAQPSADDLRELIDMHTQGKLQVTLDRTFPLSDAANAHRRLEQGVDRGKIVLEVDSIAERQSQ